MKSRPLQRDPARPSGVIVFFHCFIVAIISRVNFHPPNGAVYFSDVKGTFLQAFHPPAINAICTLVYYPSFLSFRKTFSEFLAAYALSIFT